MISTNVNCLPFYLRAKHGLSCQAPEDLRQFLAWEDAWRAALLDVAARECRGDRAAFSVGAAVVYAGAMAGYYW